MTEPYPCGHTTVVPDCGGCDPGAIAFSIHDAQLRALSKNHNDEACRRCIVDVMAGMDCEVTVSTAIPLTPSDYDYNPMTCPHGTTFYMQPTNDQILRWRTEGVR